jgi:serine/threonine protein phosphatase 1
MTMLASSSKATDRARGAKGLRAYVVGDIHGRRDLLDQLLGKIHADMERRGPRETLLVFVGDLIDRGPESAEVVERLRTYSHANVQPVFLLGNHEEVLLRILDGDASLIPSWLKFGGSQCLQSYCLTAKEVSIAEDGHALALVRRAIPQQHVEFLRGFVDSCRFGDYLFVHAGIRPGVDLDEQRQSDLRWIREPFLLDESNHGFIVVHGHTISPEVEEKPNRIGIDTGAFATDILTALGIEGDDRWFIDTRGDASASATD